MRWRVQTRSGFRAGQMPASAFALERPVRYRQKERSSVFAPPTGYYASHHFPNCVLPFWYLPSFFAVTTAGTLFALWILIPVVRSTKATVKKIASLHCAGLILLWAHVLSVFVQNGAFEAAIVFLYVYGMMVSYQCYLTMFVVIEPIYAVLRKSTQNLKRLVKVVFTLQGICWTVLQVSIISVCRAEPGSKQLPIYNSLGVGINVLAATMFAVIVCVLYIQAARLQKLIENLQLDRPSSEAFEAGKLPQFLLQLKALKKTVLILGLNSLIIIIPIVMLILGSFPYNFVLWSLIFTMWPTAPQAAQFLKARSKTPAASKSNSSKENSKLAAIAVNTED
jgi:hypothetical protein